MRHRAGGADQLRGAAEKSLAARRHDHAGHRALFGDAAGIGLVADFLRNRHRFAGQRRLIAAQILAVDQHQVGRDDLSRFDADDVAGHEGGRVARGPLAVAQHAGARRQAFLQRGKRVRGLVVLPEADDAVVDQEPGDDGKVRPVLAQRGDDGGGFDEERQRPPEIGQQLVPLALSVVFERVRPVLQQTLLGLLRAQSLLGRIAGVKCGGDLRGWVRGRRRWGATHRLGDCDAHGLPPATRSHARLAGAGRCVKSVNT